MYITIQPRRAISSQYLFQRLNPNRIILRINTYKVKNSCYASKRVIRANKNEVYSIFVKVSKYEVYIISKDKEYIILVIYKSKLTKSNKKVILTFIKVEYKSIILSKFKAMKFIFE